MGGELATADGVDAFVDAVKPSCSEQVLDRPPGVSERDELSVGHGSVLPVRQLGDRTIARLMRLQNTTYVVVFCTRIAHAPSVARKPLRVGHGSVETLCQTLALRPADARSGRRVRRSR
jgi:hypothetical protein